MDYNNFTLESALNIIDETTTGTSGCTSIETENVILDAYNNMGDDILSLENAFQALDLLTTIQSSLGLESAELNVQLEGVMENIRVGIHRFAESWRNFFVAYANYYKGEIYDDDRNSFDAVKGILDTALKESDAVVTISEYSTDPNAMVKALVSDSEKAGKDIKDGIVNIIKDTAAKKGENVTTKDEVEIWSNWFGKSITLYKVPLYNTGKKWFPMVNARLVDDIYSKIYGGKVRKTKKVAIKDCGITKETIEKCLVGEYVSYFRVNLQKIMSEFDTHLKKLEAIVYTNENGETSTSMGTNRKAYKGIVTYFDAFRTCVATTWNIYGRVRAEARQICKIVAKKYQE